MCGIFNYRCCGPRPMPMPIFSGCCSPMPMINRCCGASIWGMGFASSILSGFAGLAFGYLLGANK